MIYVYGLIAVLIASIFVGGRYLFYRYGKNDEKLKNAEDTLEAIKRGNDAVADSSYDDELRDRYGK